VRTKRGKEILTNFFPVGDDIEQIVVEWIEYLRVEKNFGPNDPLFPAITLHHNKESRLLEAGPLSSTLLLHSVSLRLAIRKAWKRAGLPYFNPHSFRNTIVLMGERICKTPEEFKA